MTDAANRGKGAEAYVQDFLKTYSSKVAAFDWERRYDAHTAGGRFPRQTYDFAWYRPGEHGGIEVKEVKHDFRLPHKNFAPEQVGKLRIRKLAGGKVVVLVYHSTTGLWRATTGIDYFARREGGSWDLSTLDTYSSCAAALGFTPHSGFTPEDVK